jgi:hypothetical protein
MAVTARTAMLLALACAPTAEFPPSQTPPPLPEDAAAPTTEPDAGVPVAADLAAEPAPAPALDPRGIDSAAVSGYQLLVRRRNADGTATAPAPFDIRGISWSPAERGAGFPDGGAYLRAADRDLPLMRAANINTVKTYLAVDRAVLDKVLAQGMVAIVTVLARSGDDFASSVESLRDHPAVLMWLIGNEWNYNRLYDTCALEACYARVAEVAARIKQIDDKHPVATSFAPTGELPTANDLKRLAAGRRVGPQHLLAAGLLQPLRQLAPGREGERDRAALLPERVRHRRLGQPRRSPRRGRAGRGAAAPDPGAAGPVERPQPRPALPGRDALRVERRVVEARQPRRPRQRRLSPTRAWPATSSPTRSGGGSSTSIASRARPTRC